MYYFSKYVYQILDCYRTHLELIDSQLIGFTATVSERPAPIYTNEVDADSLFFACNVNFNNANVLIRIQSVSPQYQWMANNNSTPLDTPIGAVAGISSQAMPVLPLIQPFFLKKNGRLQMQFTNSAASPSASTSIITWRLLKLVDPIDGGWDYGKILT
jgi:hypothetical protein